MTTKNNNRQSLGKTLLLMFACSVAFGLLIVYLLQGTNIAVMNPQGLIASEQKNLIILSTILILIIALPTVLILYFVAWRYRDSNAKVKYHPQAGQSKAFVYGIWTVPSIFVIVMAFVLVPATHRLEPKKAIVSDAEPVVVQVIAMQWKWLFIYPNQQIASVNYVQIPEDRPVIFELTADEAPMSSFWIPNLGGQLYAMTGHVNRLNLLPETIGDYEGRTAEINGAGFAGMKFTTRVSSQSDFDTWSNSVKSTDQPLDEKTYKNMLQPSKNNKTTFYSSYDTDLYAKVVMKYDAAHNAHQPNKHKDSH